MTRDDYTRLAEIKQWLHTVKKLSDGTVAQSTHIFFCVAENFSLGADMHPFFTLFWLFLYIMIILI